MKKKTDPFTIVLVILIGIGVAYLGAAVGAALDLATDEDGKIILEDFNIEATIADIDLIFGTITDTETKCFTVAFVAFAIYVIYFISKSMNKLRLHRRGVEHGSARWANDNEKNKLKDKPIKAKSKPKSKGYELIELKDTSGKTLLNKARVDNNIILTHEVLMSLNTRQTMKNLNILVVGGSGSGKSRFFAKPNILQLNTSYVVTDPKGELLQSTGKLLTEAGYSVKIFNLINMANSHNYNPFNYVYDEYIDEDGEVKKRLNDSYVIKMVNVLMKNTKKDGMSGGDQFWDDSASALITAISFYLLEEGGEAEKNFAGVMKMLKLVEIDMNDASKESKLDEKFRLLRENKPNSMAVSYYTDFKKAPPETAMSIVMSCNVRLQTFNIPDVDNLTHTDMLNLNEIGDKKTALFVIIPASDTTFNFLAAMMYTQLFDSLYNRANFKYGGRLPVHVRCILDEFANVGTIPDFEKLLATMRSMEISANVILQNISQLKKLYEKSWEDIKGNCDSFLFLGGQEMSTLEEVSKALGKETIDVKSSNRTKSHRSNSTAENNSILGRELLLPDELMRMDTKKCVLIVNREPPFFGNKYDLLKHPNYNFLEDADSANKFDYKSVATLKNPNSSLSAEEKEELYEDFLSEPFEEGDEIIMSTESDELPQKPVINSELQKIIKDSKITRKSDNVSMSSETHETDIFDEEVQITTEYSDDISGFDDEVITSLSISDYISNYTDVKEDGDEVDIIHSITSESGENIIIEEVNQLIVSDTEMFNDEISAFENDEKLPGMDGMSAVLSFMTTNPEGIEEFDFALSS